MVVATHGDAQVEILESNHSEYEHWRTKRAFPKQPIARYPVAICAPATIPEVIAAVKYAREKGLKIAVRSGGHGFSASNVRDGSLLIDLKNTSKDIEYDPSSNILRASPACLSKSVTDFLEPKGLWFPGGHCPDVALGGFLSQGGCGFMWRNYGYACGMIDHIEVITANGEHVTASAHENSDLLWAYCGGGPGFFGVVVRIALKPRPLYKHIYTTHLYIPGSEYDVLMKWALDIAHLIPSATEFSVSGMLRKKVIPGGDPKEPILRVIGVSWADDRDIAKQMLKLLETCPSLDKAYKTIMAQEINLAQEYEGRDNAAVHGQWFVSDSFLTGSHENMIKTMKRTFMTLPSPDSFALFFSVDSMPPMGNYAADITSPYYFLSYGIVGVDDTDPESPGRCRNWVKDVWGEVDEVTKAAGPNDPNATRSVGSYLGDFDQTLRPGRFMSEDHWVKWVGIRNKYDKEKRFVGFLYNPEWPINWSPWEALPSADRIEY